MDEHTLNDLLECSVCLDRLDTSSKVLPCQHTFCRKCLEVIVSSHKELRCPECRILVNLKIDDLPPNVLLMRILEGMKNAASASSKFQQNDNKLEDKQKSNEHIRQQQKHQTQHKSSLLSVSQTQQQQQQHLSPQQSTTTQQQPRRCLLPHAYAMYDFISTETSDLNFKKGDLILLKRRIDSNWFVGQSNGKEGTFPVNYVQVIVPLPTPQCIALYDFKMGPNEEEGCLTFKKGAVIHVLRRVDHNWAEGRIGTAIGIFPIAFVELNQLAKQLLETHLAQLIAIGNTTQPLQAQQQANTTNSQLQLNITSGARTTQPRAIPPPVPLLDPTESSSSTSTSTSNTTSPNSAAASSASSSSPSSSSANCSPNQSLPNTPQHKVNTGHSSVRYREKCAKDKRHSLNALLMASASGQTPALSLMQSNRHSAEILSLPHELNVATSGSSPNTQNRGNQGTTQSSAATPPTPMLAQQQQLSIGDQTTPVSSSTRVLKTTVQQNVPPTLPWGYLALYPYKPLKNDELELKKGCVYIVTERCLDGWFKGKNWQDVAGVFPGNYVTPLRTRDQQQLMHQWKYVPQTLSPPSSSTTISTNLHSEQATNTAVDGINARLSNLLPHQPPDLPPRQMTTAANATVNSSTTTCSVWTKPLGQTVEAFFSRHKTQNENKDTNTGSGGASAVSLMKRFTHMKSRSKSPGAKVVGQESTSEPKPNNDESSTNAQQQQQAVHVRSGSCPSQLLQSLPNTEQTNPAASQKRSEPLHLQSATQKAATHLPMTGTTTVSYGSQRLKANKERPHLLCARQSLDGAAFRNMHSGNNTSKTTAPSPPAAIYNNQQQQHNAGQLHANMIIAPNHRKSQSLDAGNMLNNSIGVNGGVGVGVVGAASPLHCNITEAAIKASATTKSTQCTRESRFRCVVPYPPNSDIELELHVGDIIFVQRKQKNGWYKGTHALTNKTGLFPASFVEPDI